MKTIKFVLTVLTVLVRANMLLIATVIGMFVGYILTTGFADGKIGKILIGDDRIYQDRPQNSKNDDSDIERYLATSAVNVAWLNVPYVMSGKISLEEKISITDDTIAKLSDDYRLNAVRTYADMVLYEQQRPNTAVQELLARISENYSLVPMSDALALSKLQREAATKE